MYIKPLLTANADIRAKTVSMICVIQIIVVHMVVGHYSQNYTGTSCWFCWFLNRPCASYQN